MAASLDVFEWIRRHIPILVLLVAGAVVLWRHLRVRGRQKMLKEYAWKSGFAYTPDMDLAQVPIARTALFQKGEGRATSFLRGVRGDLDTILMDYLYARGGGRNRNSVHQTVACFSTRRFALAEFSLAPRTFWSRLLSLVGAKGIEIGGHPAFSRQYVLRGADEAAVRSLFGPNKVFHFERTPGLSVEGSGSWLVVYRAGRLVPRERLNAFVDEGVRIADLFRG